MSRLGTGKTQSNFESSTSIPGMSPEEARLVQRMTELGLSQADAVQEVMNATKQQGQINALSLNPTDQATLDQAYGGAEQNLQRQGFLMGQELAGTRGLNPSDTPVSEAVLREMLPAMASLQGQKAQYGLGLGMNLAQLNEGRRQFNLQGLLGAATTTPSALGFNLGRMQNERFAQATQRQSGTQWKSDSVMNQILQGAQAYNQLGQGTSAFMSAGMKGGA